MWCKILHQFRLNRIELSYQIGTGGILTKKYNYIAVCLFSKKDDN